MMMKQNRLIVFALLFGVMTFPVSAMAAGTGILDSVNTTLHSSIFGWAGKMQTATAGLFAALAGVEVAIMFMNHVLQKRGHEDLFTGIIKKTITLGFFLWLINNAVGGIGYMPAIITGLEGGAAAVGAPPATPSTIATEALDIGIGIVYAPMASYGNHAATISQFDNDISTNNLTGAVNTAYGNFAYSTANGGGFLGVNFKAIMIIFMQTIMMLIPALIAGGGVFMLALDFLMVQLESYLAMVLGMVVLAGGGLRYTSKYVGSYIDYGIGVGVRLFVISAISWLVVTVLFKDLTQTMAIQNMYQMAFETMMLAIIIAVLPKKAVSIAQTIMSGQSSFGGEGGKALAAGAGVAAVAVTGGAALAVGGAAMGVSALAKAAAAGGAGSMSAAQGAAGVAGGSGGGAAGALSQAAGGGGDAANGVPVPAGVLSQAGGGANAAPKPTTGTQAPEKPAAGPSALAGGQKPGDGVPVPNNAPAGGGDTGSAVQADTGTGSSPVSESAGASESPAPSNSGEAPGDVPAPAPAPSAPATASDAHGVPAPAPADLQKTLDQIARNTAPKFKSGNVITRTEDSIKKYQDRVGTISEKPGAVTGKGISTEHPSDW